MEAQVDMHLGPGRDNLVRLNGQDITLTLQGVTLHQGNTGDAPTMTMDLSMPTITVGGQMRVLLSDDTRSVLVGLGWTPPAGN